jgi:hypothetical protein
MLSSGLTLTELLAIAGIVLGAGGFALSLLKHGLETRSQREARYRFFREYVNDIGADDGVARTPPLQVALGYYALGGRPGCAADEVRRVFVTANRADGLRIDAQQSHQSRAPCSGVKTDGWHQRLVLPRAWIRASASPRMAFQSAALSAVFGLFKPSSNLACNSSSARRFSSARISSRMYSLALL